ncbi:fucose permease [Oceanotoga teriensis]|uniref:Fucose permease n=1 Tax=Oceanotoga teriensis TaxID=515440 RepID=A0AA45C984_9BACT|nr:MFS transporter [Oceanotoga teriensis]PWJ96623.1 fucose permease [Oceanotoga teriensis]
MHFEIDKIERNIKKNYIFTFFSNLNLTGTIWIIFLSYKGMNLTQIGLLEGIFHLTSFFMEVPTGIIADFFGRKTSRSFGRFISIISNIIFINSNNFYFFTISMIFNALSYNLESGAGQALLYDSLINISKEEEFLKISGKIEFITQIGMLFGYLLGGYFADKSFELAYNIAIIIGIINFLYSFSFEEPKIKYNYNSKNFANFINQNKDSFKELIKDKKLFFIVLFSELLTMFCTTVFFYLQNDLYYKGFNTTKIGLIFSISGVISAFFSIYTQKIKNVLTEKGIFLIFPIIISISLISMGISKIPYIFFILISISESIIFVTYSDYINKKISSDKRATILSMCSMIFSIYMIIIFPLFGKIGDIYGLQKSFLSLGLILLIPIFINIIINIKK